jgi:hypothetical protein
MSRGLTIRACATGLAAALAVSACAPGDVELNGAVFDYLGVSSKSQAGRGEAKLAPRAGLVVPPNAERLPEPGSVATGSVNESWPSDPEQQKANAASDIERRHAAFCQEALWKAKVRGDQTPVRGPNGPCNPSILSSVNTNTTLGRPKEGAPDPLSQMPSTFKKQ